MSLEDPNHVVRLIAVKVCLTASLTSNDKFTIGIFQKIKTIIFETWKVMPRTIRVAICNALFNKLAFDKASAEVSENLICLFEPLLKQSLADS